MRAGGSGKVRSAARTRRLIWWRVTERRATFFDTTTAYPRTPAGITTEKWGEESRRPALRAEENIARGRRSRRENTLFRLRDRQVLAADAAAALDNLAPRCGFRAREESVGLRALPLLWLIGHFCHNNVELGYTQDTNSFSPKRHGCLVLF